MTVLKSKQGTVEQFGNVRQVSSHMFGSGSPPPLLSSSSAVNFAVYCAH